MHLLSSYRLSDDNNARITEAIGQLGGTFVPTTFDDGVDEIVDRIDAEISKATVFLGGRLSQPQFDRAALLEWIHVPWAGVNALMSLSGLSREGLLLTNSSGVMADSVADQVAAYLVMLHRSLPKQLAWQRNHEWNRYTSVEHPDRQVLRGKTIGIVGFGAIGREIGIRAKAFGMHVVGIKRRPEIEAVGANDIVVGPGELHAVLKRCDVVVVTLPLTPETEGMFGAAEFNEMKRSAYFVNVARGRIVDESALIAALRANTIAGAALDVFYDDPLPSDSPFWEMEQVIVTPHSSGGFVGFGDRTTELFLENLRRFQQGGDMLNRVDPTTGY